MESQTTWTHSSPLQRMNRTELYQLCTKAGILVHPATPRQYLIGYLSGEYDPPPMDESTHPTDRWRHGIINFILDFWPALKAQLKCPARNLRTTDENQRDPRPCFGCLDAQVMTCVVKNSKNESRLRLYLPQGKNT